MKRRRKCLISSGGGSVEDGGSCYGFLSLPDDILLFTLTVLASCAGCIFDLVKVAAVCKTFGQLATEHFVLSEVSTDAITDLTRRWLKGSETALELLKRCAEAGNTEACYFLGMMQFYCKGKTDEGLSLICQAAEAGNPAACYSLAVIHFNGSASSMPHRDLTTGFTFCMKAAFLGHSEALYELGYCLKDGYGVERNRDHGWWFHTVATIPIRDSLVLALTEAEPNIEPGDEAVSSLEPVLTEAESSIQPEDWANILPLCHPVNQLLAEWATPREDESMGLCDNRWCGRSENRRNEFRRCTACSRVKYCSRACQVMDWWYHTAGCPH